jgi:hypothetical protein
MFGMLESLAKAAAAVVTVPVAVVADVVTLGGSLTDKEQPYTADAVGDLVDNLKDATRPERK